MRGRRGCLFRHSLEEVESGVGGEEESRGRRWIDTSWSSLREVQELRRATKRLAGALMWYFGERIPERIVADRR